MNVKRGVLVLGVILLIASFGSCSDKEEQQYGKIDTKNKNERELIQKVQNAVFEVNPNVTLKEAIAANEYAKNVVWSIAPLDKLGTYIVRFQFDIEPLNLAMKMDFFDDYDGLLDSVFHSYLPLYNNRGHTPEYAQIRRDFREYNEGDILSPIGHANIFSRFIFGEILNPSYEGSDKEMMTVLDAYTEYRKEYAGVPVFIPLNRVPDYLPEPFFVPTAARFEGYCYEELSSDDTEFLEFRIEFDFRLPYMDNKEYEGIGLTSGFNTFYGAESYNIINAADGLAWMYMGLPIGLLYPYPNDPMQTYMDMANRH
jgi:hypothetical protein